MVKNKYQKIGKIIYDKGDFNYAYVTANFGFLKKVVDITEQQAKQEIAKEIFDDLNLELKKQFERDKKEFNEKGYNTTELEAHNFVMNNLVKKLKAKFLSVGSYTNKTNKKVQLKQEV